MDPPTLVPVSAYASTDNYDTIQKTTITVNSEITIAQGAVTETGLAEWKRFFISQMYSNEPFTVDCGDVPGIHSELQCAILPQNLSSPRRGCLHYTQSLNAVVVSTVENIKLESGVTETRTFGNGAGGEQIDDGSITFNFDSTGVDLELVITGFDVDSVDDIRVSVNNAVLGNLQNIANDAFGAPEVFSIPAHIQFQDGTNTVTISHLQETTETWGFKDILIRNA